MSGSNSEAAGRDDVDPGLPAEGPAGDAASDDGRFSDRGRSSDGGAPPDRSPSAEGSANGAVPGAEAQTELGTFWARAHSVAGIAPLGAILDQDSAAPLRPPTLAFGDSPETSDCFAKLMLDGERSATSAWLASYEAEGADIPEVGDLSIMCDDAGRPLALLRTADVHKIPFASVDPEIARAEGESTLDEWKAEHRDFLAREYATLGIEFDPGGDVAVKFAEVFYHRDGV